MLSKMAVFQFFIVMCNMQNCSLPMVNHFCVFTQKKAVSGFSSRKLRVMRGVKTTFIFLFFVQFVFSSHILSIQILKQCRQMKEVFFL